MILPEDKTLYFCTVSDSKFVLETTTLFNSLQREASLKGNSISLTVLCLDDKAVELYKKIDPGIHTVSLSELNDSELLNVRNSRKHGEFAQTSKASLVCYLLNKMKPSEILTFIDSDIYYYNDPAISLKNNENWSVLITPHWFTAEKKERAKQVGTYNSGFVSFRNDEIGKKYAETWRKDCIQWCFNKIEVGKFTDQYYLENWPQNPRIAVSKDKGVNVGTWSLDGFQVRVTKSDNKEIILVDNEPLVCYHFHGLKLYLTKKSKIRAYPVTVHHKEIYERFIHELQKSYEKIIRLDPTLGFRFSPHPGILRIAKQIVFKWFGK